MSAPPSIESIFEAKRTAVDVRGWALAGLTFQTLGIVYSDLATSPLYTLNGLWPATQPVPSDEDVIGGVSAIVWSLIIVPLIKYVFISLHFGTSEGEGGTFALFQGLYPTKGRDYASDRTLTVDSYFASVGRDSVKTPKLSTSIRWPLLIWCLFGTSLTMADGIFTPAVSVTSAVAGIGIAQPSINSDIIPISIAILVVLFLGQRFGTTKIGFLFAPVAALWLALIGVCGIYNITFYPGILRALDPSRAIMLFVRTKDYDILAGVLLALTGSEAMFANLGQFNALSIRISFSTCVFPPLLMAYLGQGARLIKDGDAVLSNIFFQTIPGPVNGPLYWIVFVVGILATIIASQTLITATFSLSQQLINMKSLPPIRMVYTSDTIQGQIYIPAVNWILMVVTIVIVAAFKSSVALTNAFGFAVATVFFSTSILLAVQMRYVKHVPIIIAIAYFVIFGFVDGLFWGAALKKVPNGAWVPLMIGVILTIFMVFWTWAKGLEDNFENSHRRNLGLFIVAGDEKDKETSSASDEKHTDVAEEDSPRTASDSTQLYFLHPAESSDEAQLQDREELTRIPSCAVFHKLAPGKGVPHSFVSFLCQWPALPRVVVFLSVCVLPIPRVPSEDRYVVNKVRSVDGIYGATYYIGFREDFEVKIDDLIERICLLESRANSPESTAVVAKIRAVAKKASHIVPHYNVRCKRLGSSRFAMALTWVRSILIQEIYQTLAAMFPETANWLNAADEIVHVGVTATI